MIFIKNIPFSPAPWRIEDANRGTIIDLNDKRVATIPKPLPGRTNHHNRMANLAAIACAPELLGALKEAVYKLEQLNVPASDACYDLINRSSYGVHDLVPKKD
jgi:hypothetical protein